MTNVIQFPITRIENEQSGPSSMEEIKVQAQNMRHVWVNEMTEVMISTLVQQMEAGGFHIMDDLHDKDFGFLIETVRSSLCKTIDLYHPFQKVAENIMDHHPDMEGVLVIADSIAIKFDDEKNASDDAVEAEASPEVV